MALEREKIFDSTSVKALREEINSLKGSLSQMADSGEDCRETTEKLYLAEKELASAMAVRRGEQNASATSIAGMEQQLKALQGTLRGLSEDQKKSDWAKNMVKEAEELSEKLNHAKQDIGDFRNNIGRYADSVDEAFGKMGVSVKSLTGPMKLAGGAVKDLGGAMKALFANPWMLLIAAIVMVLKKLVDAFKNNKKAMDGLRKGLEPLKPIMNAFHNVLGLVGEALGKVVGWISDKLSKAFQWLLGVLPTVVNAVIDAINFISLPVRKFWSLMLEGAEGIVNVIGMLPGMGEKMQKAANVINKIQTKLSEGFQHVSFDLTSLTADTEDNTKANEENANSHKAAANAAKERAKAIEELKKKLDEDSKDELTKLKEKYEYERKLIAGNIEYEKKLREAYEKKVSEIEAKKNQAIFDQTAKDMQFKAKYDINGNERPLLEQQERLINNYKSLEAQWGNIMYHFNGTEETVIRTAEAIADAAESISVEIEGIVLNDLFPTQSNEPLSDEEAKDRLSQLLLGVPYAGLENPEGLIRLSDAYDKWVEARNSALADMNAKLKESAKKFVDEAQTSISQSLQIADKNLDKELFKIEKKYTDSDRGFFAALFDPSLNKNIAQRITEEYNAEMDALAQKASIYANDVEYYTLSEEQKLKIQAEYGEASQIIFDEFNAKRVAAQENYDNTMMKMEQKRLDHTTQVNSLWRDSVSDTMGGVVRILDNVTDAWANSVDAQVASGSKSQEWADKQFEKMKGIQSASAMINALLSANEAYSSLASIPYVGPALGAAAAAASLAAGIANVVLINKQQKNGTSASGGTTPVIPSMVDSTPYSYTRTLNTEAEEDVLNRPLWVSVVDIENGLNQARVVQQESTF